MANSKTLTRAEAEAFRTRWLRVNEFQVQETRRMSLSAKLRQANMLFRLAKTMHLQHRADDPEIAGVRARWLKLQRLYEKSKRA